MIGVVGTVVDVSVGVFSGVSVEIGVTVEVGIDAIVPMSVEIVEVGIGVVVVMSLGVAEVGVDVGSDGMGTGVVANGAEVNPLITANAVKCSTLAVTE